MKNGRADHDDDEPDDPKIARIEEERRRRQRGEGGRSGGGGGPGGGGGGGGNRPRLPGGGTLKEWLIGALLVAMAIGFVASLIAPLVR